MTMLPVVVALRASRTSYVSFSCPGPDVGANTNTLATLAAGARSSLPAPHLVEKRRSVTLMGDELSSRAPARRSIDTLAPTRTVLGLSLGTVGGALQHTAAYVRACRRRRQCRAGSRGLQLLPTASACSVRVPSCKSTCAPAAVCGV